MDCDISLIEESPDGAENTGAEFDCGRMRQIDQEEVLLR